ncbi:MAG: hypothetical protein ABII71_00850 [Candidatus Micrarchaeota archaeon]
MFEGIESCSLCRKEFTPQSANFRVGLTGHTFAFCDRCAQSRRPEILRMLM